MATTIVRPTEAPAAARQASRVRFVLFLLALLVIVFSRKLIVRPEYDWFNLIPLIATFYLGYSIIVPQSVFGHIDVVTRRLSDGAPARKPRGSFLFSHWFRSCLLVLVILGAGEFALRCLSYHRALLYERHGDLLFTPVPKQEYVEKISLSPSRTNEYGLRGGPVDLSGGKTAILCLGDSVTYGYGVDDAHTYPAELEQALNQQDPGKYAVLNAGVDAYGITLMDQKFLYVWNQGLRPQLAIVGYSFNEGPLEPMVDSPARLKDQFAARVRQKNLLRSFALYNVVVENWARSYYDKMKKYMVPGTNSMKLTREDLAENYEGYLARLVGDLESHNVRPVFLLLSGFDGQTNRYDSQGIFQKRFQEFAEQHAIPLLRSEDALREGEAPDADLRGYFVDRVHMNEKGCEKVSRKLAAFLRTAVAEPPVTSEK